MKKFISLLLTLAMVLSLAVPALAAEPAVTGNQSGEVSGTYNPTVAITGVSLIVDGTTYTSGNVTITPDSTVTLTVTGTNLQYGTNDHRVQFASGMNVPINSDYFTFSDDGTTATGDATASNFSNSSNHEIVYYNDYTSVNRTPISTGIYVTYDSGIAEEDKAVISGVSITVDGTEYTEGLVTVNAESTVELKVYGTNLQYGSNTQKIQYGPQGSVNMSNGYGWKVSQDGTWATSPLVASVFCSITAQFTIRYSNNNEQNWLDSNVSLIYDSSKDADITGLSVTVDGVPYTSGNVTVYSDSEVTVTVTGTNLDNANENHAVKIIPDITTYIQDWTRTETTVTMTFLASRFSGADSFQLQYCNDWLTLETWHDTGIYLTYNEGTKPVPTNVTFKAMLKAVDSRGSEVTGVAGYLDGDRVMYSTQGTYPDTSTGTHTIGGFVVNTEVYKLPADIILTVADDGNGNGILTTESTHASITTETIDGQTVYVITVTLEEKIAEPQAKWGTSVDNLTGSGTLDEAIAAATADSSITYIQLQSDVTTDNSYLIESGVFTLDLNGKTLSSAASALHVSDAGTVVTLTDTAAGGKVTAGEGGVAVFAGSSGKVVINGGSYSGSYSLSVRSGGIAEIKAGTFTLYSLIGRTIFVDDTSSLTITGGTFTAGFSSLYTKGTTTITGGTFTSGSEGHITYMAGTLDLSGYDTEKLNGLTLSQLTGADLTVSDENIKLPAGYVFQDSEGTTVTTLAHETVYTIAAEATKPTYAIETSGEGGTVTADKAAAAEGETVTVTVTPNENYVLFSLSAYEPNNGDNTVELTPGTAANTYTFLMPAHDVSIFGDFTKDGKAREDLYFNNNGNAAWTNVAAVFYTNSDHYIDRVNLVLAENGIYTLPKDVEIPNLAYRVYFSIGTAMTAKAEIPTGENNMFTLGTATNESGHYEGTWSKYTPSQPPEEVASAEITWGSMAFTYTDGENGAEGAWSVDGTAEDAGTVTVTNTGTASITASAAYTSATNYEEIDGTLGDAKTLAAGEKGTFTLTLTGKPNKALNNEKIGTVTITIEEYDPVYLNISFGETVTEAGRTIGHSRHTVRFYDANGGLLSETAENSSDTETVAIPSGAETFALYYKPYDYYTGELPVDRNWYLTAKSAVPAADSNVNITFTNYDVTTVTVTAAE